MPLEATMMIIDNSEYMRNGDYQPTRFDAQSDAVTTVFGSKIDSNPENTVGVMTNAGKGPEVLVTHTKDLGQILQALHSSSQRVSGQSDIPTSLSVAQLALKHRQNKNLRQRIIVFVGSPLTGAGADEKSMVRLAKKLKKNNVAVDIVCFGDEEGRDANEPILKAFVDNVISGDNSHFVAIPAGPDILSDIILSSPILSEDLPGGGASGEPSGSGAIGGSNNFEFGIDPSLDPELAMALRMSLEEERARQAASGPASGSAPAATAAESSTLPSISESSTSVPALATSTTLAPAVAPASHPTDDHDADEEALLAQALALSQQSGEDVEMADASVQKKESAPAGGAGAPDDEEMSEEEAIAKAIEMSMQEDQEDGAK